MFIVFEGIDGSGKTTIMNHVYEELNKNYKVLTTREPTNKYRDIIFNKENTNLEDFFLFMADRSQHVAKVIKPMLECDVIVLCDRFSLSTVAYQFIGNRISYDLINACSYFANVNVAPDLTFVLDIEPEIALQRATNPNKFEEKGLDYYKKLSTFFKTYEASDVIHIDASDSISNITKTVLTHIKTKLNEL